VSVPAIHCRSLVKRYGDLVAVDGIDLEVAAGECFGLLGPNGAGKTTAVEMLEGLTRKDSGVVELFGQAWGVGRDRQLRQRFGVQLQDTQLADKLRVEVVFSLFRSFYPRGRTPDELLGLLELERDRKKYFSALSGGLKQRVALGCALAGDPELLFLDEPTTGLDPRARKALRGVIEGFRSRGGTVLLTTHYMEEATALCDRVAIMDRGKIIALGTPRALVDGLGLVQFVEFETGGALDEQALRARSLVDSVDRRGARYRLRLDRTLTALSRVLDELERQGVTPIGLSAHQATLDDVFLALTGRALATEAENGLTSARPPAPGTAGNEAAQ
jgi:ABC-2 type transport system ATP-binding protein